MGWIPRLPLSPSALTPLVIFCPWCMGNELPRWGGYAVSSLISLLGLKSVTSKLLCWRFREGGPDLVAIDKDYDVDTMMWIRSGRIREENGEKRTEYSVRSTPYRGRSCRQRTAEAKD